MRSHKDDRALANGCIPALFIAVVTAAIGIAVVLWLGGRL